MIIFLFTLTSRINIQLSFKFLSTWWNKYGRDDGTCGSHETKNLINDKELNKFTRYVKFASEIAKITPVGKVIALIGDLGTGKTTFAKGFADVLCIRENVGSPTFKLVSEYQGNPHNLYHIDCYRLRDEIDFLNIGGKGFISRKCCYTHRMGKYYRKGTV